jgi:hypothetical protein
MIFFHPHLQNTKLKLNKLEFFLIATLQLPYFS